MGGMLLGGLLNKLGRPQKYAMASLISGAPVGCWHLTVGNPKSPILEIGNLICTGSEIEHYGPLGLDDFPTGIRVKVNLEHGQPRDIMGIEQMYGRGDTRIYAPLGKNVMLMYEKATSVNTVSSALNKTANSLKNNTNSTIDKMDTPINSETKTNIPNIKPSTDITSLKRYFGTEEKQLIVNAGGEALFGNEKRKNNHMAKK
jgi:hypothetical protein